MSTRGMSERQAGGDGGAAARQALEAGVAAEHRGALAHAEQAERGAVARRARMARDVADRLLEDAEQRRRALRVELQRRVREPHLAADAGAARELGRLPFERRADAE